MNPASPLKMEHRPPPLYGAEFEHDLLRETEQGFETTPWDIVNCLTQGTPSRLERWHYHDEFELHFIAKTRGTAYIGDDIADFKPGFLVLIGPGVPHNLVSEGVPEGGSATRSLLVLFREESLRKAMELFPELIAVMPLLDRARHGVEFLGVQEDFGHQIQRIQKMTGLARFSEFSALLTGLAKWPSYRLLSTTRFPLRSDRDSHERSTRKIEQALSHIYENFEDDLSLAAVSSLAGMGQPSFSRAFHRATGLTFTEFVARLRVGKACQLLRQGTVPISTLCYQVGFNNISNFNRQFRNLKGMTPSEYRRDTQFLRSPSSQPL